MNRSPIYADDRKSRVISLPNGRWLAQTFTGGSGQNRTTGKDAKPHLDPWQAIAPPTDDRARAVARINPQPGIR